MVKKEQKWKGKEPWQANFPPHAKDQTSLPFSLS